MQALQRFASVDNISVNLGTRNSLILQEYSCVYVLGCACHILHNTSWKAASALTVATGFDIEIDVAYGFDKSTKQKACLEEL